jgi:protein-tyrosine phosphatase
VIDLHCHLLPSIDDGAPDLDAALEMARMAVADGITTIACTPHIYPGMFENDSAAIRRSIDQLRGNLAEAGIPLALTWGADAHVSPDLLPRLKAGTVPSLNDSRYFLLEPPHHVAPPQFDSFVFALVAAGYVPVITHPERLSWIDDHYDTFCSLSDQGAWMQVTAGALTGRFGKGAQYWGERMLDEGRVDILATDAHHPQRRPPLLAEGREAAARWVGKAEANHLVETRPLGILENRAPDAMPPRLRGARTQQANEGLWRRLFGRAA